MIFYRDNELSVIFLRKDKGREREREMGEVTDLVYKNL